MAMLVMGWVLAIGLVYARYSGWAGEQANPNRNLVTSGSSELVLKRNRAGHYVADGEINGTRVTFLVDTGATQIALPLVLARRLNVPLGGAVQVQTAAGPALGYQVRLNSVRLGSIEMRDIGALATEGLDADTVLLGMNFLRRLEMIQRGDQLILRPLTG
jgi:aspartyl protease family protein